MLLLSRFNAPALPVEPHIAAAAYYDRQEALNDEHEAQQKRAYETLIKDFSASTPETWAKARTIGRTRTSPDELLFDALGLHEDKSVINAFNALMCSDAAAELREAVASFYADKYKEDFDSNSNDGAKEFPHA